MSNIFKIERYFQKLKGSLKDPFWHFRTISIFLFFLLIILPPFLKGDFFSSSLITPFLVEFSEKKAEPFLCPTKTPNTDYQSFLLVQNSSLKANIPPALVSGKVLGALVGDYEEEENRNTIVEYIVEQGDTLLGIAEKFNISLNTLLWANNLNKSSTIKPGQKLIIPPVSGVIHYVKSGDTISEIAKIYKAKIEEIVEFNQLADENDIYIGDILVVPNGVIPAPSSKIQNFAQVPLASSQFIAPVIPPYIITQGLHWYNAIDFSHSGGGCGKPIVAAAEGTVQKTGYDKTAGNYVRILHSNGVVTFYGHLSSIWVVPGQSVSQGTIIGLIGNTGYTRGVTGCHVHFEVRGAKNPFAL